MDPVALPDDIIDAVARIPQPALVHTAEKSIFVNAALVELLEYSRPEQMEDRFMGEFIAPWHFGHPRMGRREAAGKKRGGGSIDIEISTLPLYCSDVTLYQSIIRDITERKHWEGAMLQSERLTAMGRLAGEIAHEINNPLGGILLYANLIHEDLDPGSQARANLEKIIKLATRCRIIAKGLLNFGRSSSKTYAPVDLNKVISDMYSLIEDHKILKRVSTKFSLSRNLPHLMGDRGQLEQVVLNIVINAGEAMKGQGELRVNTHFSPDTKTINMKFEDTGPGIPEEIKSRIFEPFFTTKQPGRGTGLGLSITHGIVQRHGGKIRISGEVGSGACFELIFPVNISGPQA